MRRLILVCLLTLLLAATGLGWWWKHGRSADADDSGFLRRKIAFLESENLRLSRILAEKQTAAEAAADAPRRAEIEKTVSRLRALPFLKPVAYHQIPRTDLPAVLQQKLAQQVPDREFAAEGIALAALGLLPTGVDLKKTYLNLLGEQVGAFYDQHTGELVTFSGQPLDNSQNRVILAHELTHALEDQHFHLANLPLDAKGNDDRVLAASALVEGDATLVMNRYLLGEMSASVLKESLSGALTTDVRQLAAAPRFLRESLVFPYLRGQEFCQALYEQGGWTKLAAAFQHPPSSTAQILHPALFLSNPRREPVEVRFESTSLLGQQPVADNVAGEFEIRQLLAGWLGDGNKTNEIAAGWVGDRYLVYGDAKVNSYLWRCLWTSEAAAQRFVAAMQTGWQARYRLGAGFETTADHQPNGGTAGQMMAHVLPDGRRLQILQDHNEVNVIEAQDPTWLQALEKLP